MKLVIEIRGGSLAGVYTDRLQDFDGEMVYVVDWGSAAPGDDVAYGFAVQALSAMETETDEAVQAFEDHLCMECGDYYEGGGDGYDGMCPSCADRAEEGVAIKRAYTCDNCKGIVEELIGCPDGREVCQTCFEEGVG